MPLTPFEQKNILDYLTGAAAAVRPASRFISIATQSPTSQSAFDGPFSPRMSYSANAANSPAGSASNRVAMSCTATAAATAVGWNLWDSNQGGTRIAYGTLSASVGCASADTLGFAANRLILRMT